LVTERQVAASVGTNRWIASYAWSWISGSRKSGTISAWSMTGPVILLAALVFSYVFLGGLFLSTSFLIMMVVLCTLHGPEVVDELGSEGDRRPAGTPK